MPLKIIFMGTPDFAVPILRAINESRHSVLQVYTQPPKKKNRGQKIDISSVHKFANQENIKIKYPENLEDKAELEYIENISPDVIVVVAYGKILPKKLLKINKTKFINVHASLLPRWRGAAPIQRAIMNLDKETGISIMKIEPKLDSGPLLMSSKIDISKETNCYELTKKLSFLGAELVLKSLDQIENKKEKYTPQSEIEATYAKKISKDETKIDWGEKAKKVVAKINALNFHPGSWFEMNGYRIKPIKVIEVKARGLPGKILDNNFTIACSENAVQILELQKEGKQKMTTKEFLKGNDLKVGDNI